MQERIPYKLRMFSSATGNTYWQVMNLLGERVYESVNRADAEAWIEKHGRRI